MRIVTQLLNRVYITCFLSLLWEAGVLDYYCDFSPLMPWGNNGVSVAFSRWSWIDMLSVEVWNGYVLHCASLCHSRFRSNLDSTLLFFLFFPPSVLSVPLLDVTFDLPPSYMVPLRFS